MRVKIESDGTMAGTRVVDVATGESLNDVTAIRFNIEGGTDMLYPEIVLERIPLAITGGAKSRYDRVRIKRSELLGWIVAAFAFGILAVVVPVAVVMVSR